MLCREGGSLIFEALPGTKLRLAITFSGQSHLPSGDLMLVSAWPNTKDKMVNDSLSATLRPFAIIAMIIGILLLALVFQPDRRKSL